MNRIEHFIYQLVKSNPGLKTFLRNRYQDLFDILPRANRATTKHSLETREGFFFGFHDKTPFSKDDELLLSQRAPDELFMPEIGNEIEIGVFNGENWSNFEPVSTTKAWNWHMGCRLQWVNRRKLIFNDALDGQVTARLMDLDEGTSVWQPYMVSSVSNSGSFFVGYDFLDVESLMPGYGYKSPNQRYFNNKGHSELVEVDLLTKTKRILIEKNQLLEYRRQNWALDPFHFISHTQISRCDRFVAFLHRWIDTSDDVRKRKSRLMVINRETHELIELPTDGMVSHYCWAKDLSILAFCSTQKFGSRYVQFDLSDFGEISFTCFSDLRADGHPSFNIETGFVVTDTYPNRSRDQFLYTFRSGGDEYEKIASFFMPKKFQSPSPFFHWSVDLHPRWSTEGHHICVDTAHTGRRCQVTLRYLP
jgi:hypothetical protein